VAAEIEGQDAAHVDVLVPDRYEGTLSTEAIESSPLAAHSAETRSVWLDASAAVNHP
jgi:hypothetical protein